MDPIANSLAQIKNAVQNFRKEVNIKYAKINLAVLEILKTGGFIGNYEVIKEENKKYPTLIKVTLKYRDKEPVFKDIKIVSRSGRRVYTGVAKIHVLQRGKLDVLISTSQGMMSGREARKKGLGGEVICEVK